MGILAGDLTDPHGTHRVCLEAILGALEELKYEVPPTPLRIGMAQSMHCVPLQRCMVRMGVGEGLHGCPTFARGTLRETLGYL
jgi:hypothetical protein